MNFHASMLSVGTKTLYTVTWHFYLIFFKSVKHYWSHSLLKYRESWLFRRCLKVISFLYNLTCLAFCCWLNTVFWQEAMLDLVLQLPCLPPILLSVYSHSSFSSSACVTTYWFGVVHWSNWKGCLDFCSLFCSIKPTMK